MFVALRDLRFAKGRFLLMGSVVVLVAVLMVMLSGLSSGLVKDNAGGLDSFGATHFAFASGSDVSLPKSTVSAATWEGLAGVDGVTDAAPVGLTTFTAKTDDGRTFDLNLAGVEPGSFPVPAVTTGADVGSTPNGVVVTQKLLDDGIGIGDTLRLDRTDVDVTVVGAAPEANVGHLPLAYAPLALWRQATFGTSTPADVATVVALRAPSGTDFTAADDRLGVTTLARAKAYAGSPGFSEETGTVEMIQVFLYVISAVLVGAFFTVWTIQRKGEIGLLKALGASNRYLLRDAMGQASVVLLAATAAGVLVGVGLGAAMPARMPFALEPRAVFAAAAAIVVTGLVGGAMSIRRITRVDPLIALTGAR